MPCYSYFYVLVWVFDQSVLQLHACHAMPCHAILFYSIPCLDVPGCRSSRAVLCPPGRLLLRMARTEEEGKGLGFLALVETVRMWREDRCLWLTLSPVISPPPVPLCPLPPRRWLPPLPVPGAYSDASDAPDAPDASDSPDSPDSTWLARRKPLNCSDLWSAPDRVGLLDAGSFVEWWARPPVGSA